VGCVGLAAPDGRGWWSLTRREESKGKKGGAVHYFTKNRKGNVGWGKSERTCFGVKSRRLKKKQASGGGDDLG